MPSVLDPLTLMVFLASLSSSLLIAAFAVLVVVLGGIVAYLLAQSRRRAAVIAEQEAEEANQRDAELAHIRQRIEEIYERQQTGSETQFARVNQELEQLQMNLDAKGRQIDGVQGQLHYQLKRHEDEIAELRNQLREAVEVFAAAALPAARPSAPALAAHTPSAAPEPQRPADRPVVKHTPIQAPQASEQVDDAPSFAPLGELLKDDQELLDDLFSGTDLDSQDEPAEALPAFSTSTPEERPSTPTPRAAAPPPHPAPEPKDRSVPTEASNPTPSFPSIPDEVIADQLEGRDDFEFVEIDPSSMNAAPEEEVQADDPTPSLQPEASQEYIDLPPVTAWPEESHTQATSESTEEPMVPAHSGDGMSTASFDDPFAETSPTFHPEPSTDLDSATPAAKSTPSVPTEPSPSAPEIVVPKSPEAMPVSELDTEALATELLPADETQAAASETDYEALTAITAIDEDIQAKLYALGVTEVEEIARWTRADARRIASQLAHVTEEDIMDRWIFEAQSILFERYQDELREQREQHLSA